MQRLPNQKDSLNSRKTKADQANLTIGEILKDKNSPERLRNEHGVYLRFAKVGDEENPVGAELLSSWYERNIRIFTNIQRLAEQGDRILVIYGSGHLPILRQLVLDDPDLALVEISAYLPD